MKLSAEAEELINSPNVDLEHYCLIKPVHNFLNLVLPETTQQLQFKFWPVICVPLLHI